MRFLLLTIAFALPALCGEYAVLGSGFRLYVDHHETTGANVELHTGQGVMVLPASQVLRFEADDYVAAPSAPAPSTVTAPLSPREIVDRAALRNGLPPALVHSVASVESGYRTGAVSPKGAVGIMQLMPQTARDLNADPSDPRQNADAGARYLRELLLKYRNDPYQLRKALAGYNAGPAAVDRYNGVPPFPETQQYVRRVLDRFRKLAK